MEAVNRTLMELKYDKKVQVQPDTLAVNRTLMELKWKNKYRTKRTVPSVNRTLMELKYGQQIARSMHQTLLIVP